MFWENNVSCLGLGRFKREALFNSENVNIVRQKISEENVSLSNLEMIFVLWAVS